MINNRPLSPHITVHNWILSQIMSILLRASAIVLSFGIIFISILLLSLSFGLPYYLFFKMLFFNFIGKLIVTLISFCFFFHFADEFRKIFWVFGIGLDIKIVKITSYIVIFFSLIFSFFIFISL